MNMVIQLQLVCRAKDGISFPPLLPPLAWISPKCGLIYCKKYFDKIFIFINIIKFKRRLNGNQFGSDQIWRLMSDLVSNVRSDVYCKIWRQMSDLTSNVRSDVYCQIWCLMSDLTSNVRSDVKFQIWRLMSYRPATVAIQAPEGLLWY